MTSSSMWPRLPEQNSAVGANCGERVIVPLHQVCLEVASELRVAFPGRDLRVRLDEIESVVDRAQLKRLAENLLRNAFEHGDRVRPVELTLISDGDCCLLAVHHQGAPIPPELVPFVLTPFGRKAGKPVGQGLYLASTLVEALGGTLAVESTLEHGTTLTVRLPRG